MAEWDTALDGFQTMWPPLNFSPLPSQTLGDSNECRGLAHLCAITVEAAPPVAALFSPMTSFTKRPETSFTLRALVAREVSYPRVHQLRRAVRGVERCQIFACGDEILPYQVVASN
jgi:hypothetical protein